MGTQSVYFGDFFVKDRDVLSSISVFHSEENGVLAASIANLEKTSSRRRRFT